MLVYLNSHYLHLSYFKFLFLFTYKTRLSVYKDSLSEFKHTRGVEKHKIKICCFHWPRLAFEDQTIDLFLLIFTMLLRFTLRRSVVPFQFIPWRTRALMIPYPWSKNWSIIKSFLRMGGAKTWVLDMRDGTFLHYSTAAI